VSTNRQLLAQLVRLQDSALVGLFHDDGDNQHLRKEKKKEENLSKRNET
jgi:hypothetical protein